MPVLRSAQPRLSECVLAVWQADVRGSGRSTSTSRGPAGGRPSDLLEVPEAPSAGKQVLRLLRSAPAGSRPRRASSTGTACCGTHPAHASAGGPKTRSAATGCQTSSEARAPAPQGSTTGRRETAGARARAAGATGRCSPCPCTGASAHSAASTHSTACSFSGRHAVVHGPSCA